MKAYILEDNVGLATQLKILFLEDSGSVLQTGQLLQEQEHFEVLDTCDYRDLTSWIIDNPDDCDVLILDLMIPVVSLRFIPGCKDYDENKDHSPTLYYLQHYLLENYPEMKERIILFSAYFDEMRRKGLGDYCDQFITVSKHGPDSVDKLLTKVSEVAGKRSS